MEGRSSAFAMILLTGGDFMRSIIREEWRKLKHEKMLIPGLIGIMLLQWGVSYLLFRWGPNERIGKEYGNFGLNLYCMCGISAIFNLVSSIFINYFLLTQEYIYDTWDLIVLKVFSRTKLCMSKYFIFFMYQMVFNIFSVLGYLLFSIFILNQTVNIAFMKNIILLVIFMHLFDATIQFAIQLWLDNLTFAVVIGLLYQIIKTRIPINFPILKYTPVVSERFIFESGQFMNVSLGAVCSGISILLCFLLAYLAGRKFKT